MMAHIYARRGIPLYRIGSWFLLHSESPLCYSDNRAHITLFQLLDVQQLAFAGNADMPPAFLSLGGC